MKRKSAIIDFYDDWIEYLRQNLVSAGYKVDPNEPAEEIELMSFNLGKRRIRSRPRKLFFADEFVCPDEHKEALEQINVAAQKGSPLLPFQSKAVLTKPKAKDGLLFDWDIHHFHLGKKMDADGFVSRTRELVFARVTNDAVYFLTVGAHGDWGQSELLEIIHRNWPETIAGRRMQGIVAKKDGEKITSDEIVGARAAGIIPVVVLSDGTSYCSLGGGIATSGDSFAAVGGMFQHRRWICDLENRAKAQLPRYYAEARQKGWKPGKPIRIRLNFMNGEPHAVTVEY